MALKIGIQMYSVREEMAKDPIQTFRKASEIGYKYFELANLNAENDFGSGFGISAKELKKEMDDLGGQVISAHIDPFTESNVEKILEYHAELGTKYLISKPNEESKGEVERACERYDWLGEKCRDYGIDHCLHTGLACNLEDGSWILDTIFENTDPRNLKFEVDSYWMMRSGYEPIHVIKKFADRIIAVHQKDLPTTFKGELNINKRLGWGHGLLHSNFFEYVSKDDFCEIGTGQMPIQEIIHAVNQYTNAEYIILEQDFTKYTEFESIEISFRNLKHYKGVQV